MIQLVMIFLAFACSLLLTRYLTIPGTWFYILDHPNERSLHDSPTPRAGGLAIFITIALFIVFISATTDLDLSDLLWLAAGSVLVALVSFVDDYMNLSFLFRLMVQTIAAGIVIYGGFSISDIQFPGFMLVLPDFVSYAITGLFIIWMTNLYNFMDGMDGFAGGMTVTGFGTLTLVGWLAGNDEFMLVNALITSATAGFLVFNFPPARIFMGDVGSSFLGFLAAGNSIWASKLEILPLWFSILIFSPFIVDATVTLLRRLISGKKVWEAHKTHYYQILAESGWGHKRTVLCEYALMLLCALSAVLALGQPPRVHWMIITFWIVAYILFMIAVSLLAERYQKLVK